MAFDDLPLERTGPPPAPAPIVSREARHSSQTRWIVVLAAIVVAGSALALWWTVRERPETATPVPTSPTNASVATRRPKKNPDDLLPPVDASDVAVREMAAFLSHHPLFDQLLATKDLVRSATLGIQQIGDGKTPVAWLTVVRPETRLTVSGEELGRIDPQSYKRWNAATAALVSISPKDAAQVYVNTKPLFDAAYRDLGHPTANFDEAIVLAIQTLLATPEVAADPEVVRRPTYFEHYDPALRALRPVQKEFLLLGPGNRKQVRAWLKAFATELDLKVD